MSVHSRQIFASSPTGEQSFVAPSIGDARMWCSTLCASLPDCNVSAMPSSWDGCMNSFVRERPRCSFLGVAAAKVPIALQRSGTFLIDKQGIVRYIHQVTNPQASVEKEELMREVEQL